MKILRLNSLPDNRKGHIPQNVIPGRYIYQGGMGFDPPGKRAHRNDAPHGRDNHVHGDEEVFLILSGRARMELEGELHDPVTGDVCVIAPGEDHHLIIDEKDSAVYVYFHAGSERNPVQRQIGRALFTSLRRGRLFFHFSQPYPSARLTCSSQMEAT